MFLPGHFEYPVFMFNPMSSSYKLWSALSVFSFLLLPTRASAAELRLVDAKGLVRLLSQERGPVELTVRLGSQPATVSAADTNNDIPLSAAATLDRLDAVREPLVGKQTGRIVKFQGVEPGIWKIVGIDKTIAAVEVSR